MPFTQGHTRLFLLALLGAIFALLLFSGQPSPVQRASAASNGDGTGTCCSILGTPVPLAQTFSTDVKGDYVAAGVGMRGTGPPGAGTINLPALPGGSTVENAFLYWAVMNDTTVASLASGNINGNPITGSLIGKTANPCWSGDIHNYVADVTPYVVPGGANNLTGFASGGLPISTQPILEGASIVLVFSNPTEPARTIIIHEGAVSTLLPPPVTTTFSGFNAVAGSSKTTYIVADGQQGGVLGLNNKTYVDATETANHVLNGAGPGTEYWDTLTQTITTFIPPADTSVTIGVESAADLGVGDCITWVAQVLAVPAVEPTLTVVKDAVPDDPQDFPFTGTCFSPFSLDDDADGTLSNTKGPAVPSSGACSVVEDPVLGWSLVGISCVGDSDGGTTVNLATRTANIDLDAGEDITCTFTNEPGAPPAVGGIVKVFSGPGGAAPAETAAAAPGAAGVLSLAAAAIASAIVLAGAGWVARRRWLR